jgi:hypothetical protein
MGSVEKGPNASSTSNGTTVDISVALKANDLKIVPRLSSEIAAAGSSLDEGDYDARQALLRKARALVTALETPRETMIKHNWAEVSLRMESGPRQVMLLWLTK